LENQLGPLYLYEEKWRYPPLNHNFTSFWGPKKQVQLTLNVNSLECKKNQQLKFGEVVVIQGNYKILQLEYIKTL
jgi:hypothetical protein